VTARKTPPAQQVTRRPKVNHIDPPPAIHHPEIMPAAHARVFLVRLVDRENPARESAGFITTSMDGAARYIASLNEFTRSKASEARIYQMTPSQLAGSVNL
jgi:hypothetical protein